MQNKSFNSPYLEFRQLCRKKAVEILGEEHVYEVLPGERAGYPFFHIGESWDVDRKNKDILTPQVTQVVHLWHDEPKKIGDFMIIMTAFIREMQRVEKTRSFYVENTKVTHRILRDETAGAPLLHGVIDVECTLF